jgi:hypothetical protein
MKSIISAGKLTLAVPTVALILLFSNLTSPAETRLGKEQKLGEGTLRSYVTADSRGVPTAVGVTFSRSALQGLPSKMNTTSRCHDIDGNGTHGRHECIGDYELILEVPADVAKEIDIPFKWIMVNWNPEGHQAPAPPVLAEPHFDFHFFAWDRERIEAIAPGKCGEFVDCEDFKRGSKPLPPEYLPPGHIDVGAVVPRMGNHLLDSRSPELQDPPARFTRTFIYGAYDGELIFWEPMITRDFINATTNECFEIRQPQKVRRSGHYPAAYCVRYDAATQKHTVSLEKFSYVTAS